MPEAIALHVGSSYRKAIFGAPSLWSRLRLNVTLSWFDPAGGSKPRERNVRSAFFPALVDTGADLTVIPVAEYNGLLERIRDEYFTDVHAFAVRIAEGISATARREWADGLVKDLRKLYSPPNKAVTDHAIDNLAHDSVRGLRGAKDAVVSDLRRQVAGLLTKWRLPAIELRRLMSDDLHRVNTLGGLVEVSRFLTRAEVGACSGDAKEDVKDWANCPGMIDVAVMDPQGRTEAALKAQSPHTSISLQRPYALLGMDIINQMAEFRYRYKDRAAVFQHRGGE